MFCNSTGKFKDNQGALFAVVLFIFKSSTGQNKEQHTCHLKKKKKNKIQTIYLLVFALRANITGEVTMKAVSKRQE